MTITKVKTVDSIEVLPLGQIQIRYATTIIEDGEVISRQLSRDVVYPDHADIADQYPKVQAIASAVWTEEVKAAWETFKNNVGD